MQIQVLAKDNDKPGNKELIEFLSKNLKTLVLRHNYRFKFRIIEDSEISDLIKMGIEKLPAIIVGKQTYLGSIEAIKFFTEPKTTTNLASTGSRKKTNKVTDAEAAYSEWVASEMTMAAAEQDKDYDGSKDMKKVLDAGARITAARGIGQIAPTSLSSTKVDLNAGYRADNHTVTTVGINVDNDEERMIASRYEETEI